jgi:diguanylate cyclase (GGDEF)-like protein/PAS domain S-box-containing protein
MTAGAKARRRMIGAGVVSDMDVLRRKWNAALKPGHRLPPFEDIMLGSLGRLADHVMLLRGEAGTTLTLVRAGQYVHDWIGTNDNDIEVAQLPADCAIALNDSVVAAAATSNPTSSTAYRVRDGLVETYDVLAMPLANRWGAPLMAVYVRERGNRFELVESIYRSTNEGMIALAAVREPNGTEVVDFQILDLNDGAERLLQLPASRLRWRKIGGSSHPFATAETMARLKSALTTQRREQFEVDLAPDGGTSYVRVGLAATGDLVCATLSDVTGIKRSEASFRLLFESNPTPMWVFDVETLRFLSVNDAAVEQYGYARKRFLAMSYSDLWPAAERANHLEALQAVAEAYQSSQSWHHAKANGELIEVVTFGRRITFDDRAAFLVTVMDVTERRRAEARIAHMAHHDALTDLPNRTVFSQRLNDALTRTRRDRQRMAVLWIDLDHFKSVNDSFGHSVGDRLLKAAAERLRHAIGEGVLVARLGGDEFAVLLEQVVTPNDAGAVAERLIETLSVAFEFDGTEMTVGTSVGIALYPGDGETADEMLRNADLALYRAKADGRGTHHFFEPEMDRQAQKRRSLERDLRKGLTRGEFELYYQPLIDLASERITAFESLLRWNHPQRGMVPPVEFISVAEETGLIVPIGEWVLQAACSEAASWPDDVKIAVNLSPLQFRNRNLVAAVINALAHSGLAPERLELEITESVLLAETDSNIATLHQLRALGVRISMDDFGTGYSSLGYLRSFPFDKIKIDRSFVSEIAQDEDCAAIIRAISGLGRSLRIRTTAEGVETAAQLGRLRDEGCTEVQGYYFSPPRPASDVAGLLQKFGASAGAAEPRQPARKIA